MKRRAVRRTAFQAVEESDAFESGASFFQTVKVASGCNRLVAYVVNEGPFERTDGVFLPKAAGKGLQNCQVRRAFEIKHPACLLGLVVLIEPYLRQRLAYLTVAVANSVWLANEGNDQVLIGGFIQKHFRMACCDDLIAMLRSRFS